MMKVRRRFATNEAPSCGQGKGAGGAPRINPCVNALLTAYLAAPLRGCRVCGVRPSTGRLWAFWGRLSWWPSRLWRVPTLVWPSGIGVGGCARVVRRGMRKS